jgi:septal ring factor EnvC (AmiA/AmiB activator)
MQQENPTKAVATRLPIPKYLEVLKTATDQKLSISDYLFNLIYLFDADKIEAKDKEIERYKEAAKAFKEANETGDKQIKSLQEEIATLKDIVKKEEQIRQSLRSEKEKTRLEIASIANELEKIQGYKDIGERLKQLISWNKAIKQLSVIASKK